MDAGSESCNRTNALVRSTVFPEDPLEPRMPLSAAGGSRTLRKPPKLLLFANTDWYLFNFRIALAEMARDAGYEVVLAARPSEYADRIRERGFRFIDLSFNGSDKGILSNLKLCRKVYRLFQAEKPDLAHMFTIKCVLFGGAMARRHRTPCVNAVTGLGHVFTHDSLGNRFLRIGVRQAFRYACARPKASTIFQNDEDQELFIRWGIVDAKQTSLIRGSGADCVRFQPANLENRQPGPCRILFASRLIREKGIFELAEACRQLRREKVECELLIAGDRFPGNPSSLTESEVESLAEEFTVLGHVDDMQSLFAKVDLVALPSYREGTPRVLLEAGAAGLPLLATDIAGCRGVVEPGRNGELTPVRNVPALTDALRRLVQSPSLRATYGCESRKIIETGFSEQSVNERTMAIYKKMV